METMFLLYTDEAIRAAQSAEDLAAAMERHHAIIADAQAKGKFKGAGRLQPTKAATTVRSAGAGEFTAMDGPFAETKEALGGYYLLDCSSTEDARYWAKRLAQTGCAISVEIRPLAEIPKPVESLARAHA